MFVTGKTLTHFLIGSTQTDGSVAHEHCINQAGIMVSAEGRRSVRVVGSTYTHIAYFTSLATPLPTQRRLIGTSVPA